MLGNQFNITLLFPQLKKKQPVKLNSATELDHLPPKNNSAFHSTYVSNFKSCDIKSGVHFATLPEKLQLSISLISVSHGVQVLGGLFLSEKETQKSNNDIPTLTSVCSENCQALWALKIF